MFVCPGTRTLCGLSVHVLICVFKVINDPGLDPGAAAGRSFSLKDLKLFYRLLCEWRKQAASMLSDVPSEKKTL